MSVISHSENANILVNGFSKELERQSIADTLQQVTFLLSVFSIVLNLFIIITVLDHNLRTHLKFVLSLTFSDLLLSVCHIVIKFRKFPTVWRPVVNPVSLGWISTNGTFGSNDRPQMPVFEDGSLLDMIRSGIVLDDALKLTRLNTSELNNLFDEKFDDVSVDKELLKSDLLGTILASFYVLPSITAPLGMLLITVSVFISVVKPLHVTIILSKRRGSILVSIIWGIALTVAGTTFGLAFNKFPLEVYRIVLTTQISIWYGTLAVFVSLPTLYIVIIVVLRRSQFKHPSRVAKNWKATVTALAVTVTFALCNVPNIWMTVFGFSIKKSPFIYNEVFQSLLIVNTIFDPIIYAIRLVEVHDGCRKIFSKLKTWC